jgi:NAD(P)-dependent dehydrogenase (short-subunit alcohol dehydrogenase family)
MVLTNRVAVVYGAGEEVGDAVARAFADAGARLFLTGRRLRPVAALSREIVSSGGHAEAAEVDPHDGLAVDGHLRSVVDAAGRIDIVFAVVTVPDRVVGVPLAGWETGQRSATTTYFPPYFLVSRLAARRMAGRGSGVIMTAEAPDSVDRFRDEFRDAALAVRTSLTRGLAEEMAPHGVRVHDLLPPAAGGPPIAETAVSLAAEASGADVATAGHLR